MSVALLSFEDEAPRGSGETGATSKIARALDACGIDAPTSLYDEALALAQDGRLAPSSERLRMLLCLDPNDGDAALLLGKVLAAREQWQEALSWLDTAAANGAFLPAGLRDSVEEGLRRHVQDAEDYRARVASRERGEIRNLRSEAKRLRTDVISLEAENETLRGRVRTWAGITAVVAGSASALMLAALLFGGLGQDSAADPVGSDAAIAGDELPPLTAEEILSSPPSASPPSASPPSASPSATVTTAVAAGGGATVSIPVDQPFAASAQPDITGATPTKAKAEAPPATSTAKTETKSTVAAAAASSAAVMATHTVKKGENLGSIARKYYGDSSDWPRIQAANGDKLGGGHSLQVGMKLKIPKK